MLCVDVPVVVAIRVVGSSGDTHTLQQTPAFPRDKIFEGPQVCSREGHSDRFSFGRPLAQVCSREGQSDRLSFGRPLAQVCFRECHSDRLSFCRPLAQPCSQKLLVSEELLLGGLHHPRSKDVSISRSMSIEGLQGTRNSLLVRVLHFVPRLLMLSAQGHFALFSSFGIEISDELLSFLRIMKEFRDR